MTHDELKDAIDGLHAHYAGALDSGINDALLKKRVRGHLLAMTPDNRRATLARVVRELSLSDEVVAQGYGCSDAFELIRWLGEDLRVLP